MFALAALLTAPVAHPERPPMKREDAGIVAVGTVAEVFTSGAGEQLVRRVTLLELESVERGADLVGDRWLYVYTFETAAGPTPAVGPSGHQRTLPAGWRVRVWLNRRGGLNEGVYPNWYDRLPEQPGVRPRF